jgi:hypothetical protein
MRMAFTVPSFLHSMRRRIAMNNIVVFVLFTLMIGSLVRSESALAQGLPSPAECPFNEALDYQVVQALKANGVTDEQFEALAAAGEIGRTISGACIAEINYAGANPDTECQRANGVALSIRSSYLVVSGYLFLVTGDARTYRSNIRTILADILKSVPHRCWFQSAALPTATPNYGSPGVSGAGLTPAQCAALRANFEACKQQANYALQRCTVTPHARNCAATAPVCMPSPC